LLIRLLHKHDPYPGLYTIYHHTLIELQSASWLQKTLRLFEKNLLEQLGYGLQLTQEMTHSTTLVEDQFYRFHPEHGFEACADEGEQVSVFAGKSLLALASETLEDETVLRDAKRLMRLALAPLLGYKPLNSRQLYAMPRDKLIREDSE
jgi:DNA repair protein RecO (recombination protein O)